MSSSTASARRWSSSRTQLSTASPDAGGASARTSGVPYFLLGMGAFLALYLPQPLLPQLDHDLGTPPAVTGLVMTAALVGFAVAGLLPGGDTYRTLRWAMWLEVVASAIAALSPSIWVLLVARAGQGVGVGLMVAGGLADVPRRLSVREAGRVTGLLISGTALGGLVGRAVGYVGLLLTWRAAFAVGGAGVLVVCGLSLARLARAAAGSAAPPPIDRGRAPLSVTLAGLFILFVSVGFFDLVPYRVTSPDIHLPPALGDLVYLVFVPATFVGVLAGRAIDRVGARAVIVASAAGGIVLMVVGLVPNVLALAIGALGAICATVALHVAHSGWAASYGRSAVGRYLAMYYVGGAIAAPVCAYGYSRFGWPGVVAPLVGVTVVVLVLALARKEPDRAQRQHAEAGIPPPSPAS